MFAAGHQAKPEFGLVKHYCNNNDRNHGNQHKPVEFEAVDVDNKHLSGADIFYLR